MNQPTNHDPSVVPTRAKVALGCAAWPWFIGSVALLVQLVVGLGGSSHPLAALMSSLVLGGAVLVAWGLVTLAVIFIFMRVKGAGEDRVRKALKVAGAAAALGVGLLMISGLLFVVTAAGAVR